MKILTPINSKKRFFEMYQRVNKFQLNEVLTNTMQTGSQLVEKAFNELKNKEINIKQTNTQTIDNINFVEIIANDNNDNEITFIFKINSIAGDQDGVYRVNDAVLTGFKLKSDKFNVDFPENMKAIQEFNTNHGDDIMNVIGDYVDFKTNTFNLDDEIYEEAINLIDKIPYKKGNETIQTHNSYADEKPTNSDLRVQSNELNSFISEMEDNIENIEKDMFDLPPDYSGDEIPSDDDGSKGIDPYDQAIINPEATQDDWKVSGKKLEKPKKSPPYMDNTGNRKRAIPSWAEDFMENKEVGNVNADNLVNRNYNKLLSSRMKEFFIRKANEILEDELGIKKLQIPRDKYILMVKNKAIELFKLNSQGINEDTENNDYPNQIGKKFKTKNQFPKKKKKSQSIVKLTEDDYENIGDVSKNNIDNNFDNNLEGGLADNKEPKDFDSKQLAMGLEIELEHTNDPKIALEIAMDHLAEIPDYYTHLNKMEKEVNAEKLENQNFIEDEETDELLGYKPFNVNDYTNENMEEYTGDIGDRYQDAEGNQYTVRGKNNDSVRIQGQEGEREIDTSDIQLLKKISEEKEINYKEWKLGIPYGETHNLEVFGSSAFKPSDYRTNVTYYLLPDNFVVAEKRNYAIYGFAPSQGGIIKKNNRLFDREGNDVTDKIQNDAKEYSGLSNNLKSFIFSTNNNINEEQIKTARLVLKDRDFSNSMTKKEAVQLLIKHNIK